MSTKPDTPQLQRISEIRLTRTIDASDDLYLEGDNHGVKVWFDLWDSPRTRGFMMDREKVTQLRDYLTAWLDTH